jgi:hypothetical protein
MLALEFSITLVRINNIDWSKSQNRIMLEGHYQELSVDWPIHQVLLPKVLYLRRGISLLTQEIIPSIRIKTAPDYNSDLCSSNLNLADLIHFLAPVLDRRLTNISA